MPYWAILAFALSSCTSDAPDFYPLAKNRWSIYSVVDQVLGETRTNRYLTLNLGTVNFAEQRVQAIRSQTHTLEFFHRNEQGVWRLAQRHSNSAGMQSDNPARRILPAELQLGTTWTATTSLGLIESRTFARRDRIIARHYELELSKTVTALDQQVSVPAADFSGCIEVTGHGQTVVETDRGNAEAMVTVETREWYAPNVGLVKLTRRETSESSFLKPGQQNWHLLDYGY